MNRPAFFYRLPQVMIEHYLNIGLGKYKDDIAPFVAGWGE